MECRLSLMYVCISTASLSSLPLNVVRKELENLANMSRKKQAGLNALLTGFGADYVKPAREGRAYGTCRLHLIRDVYPGTKESGPKKKIRKVWSIECTVWNREQSARYTNYHVQNSP